ncbi:MAG: urease subunit beta [Dehalococcoidia bacterium]|nr:urease subunit beta [Dehalococcoidia bacterium]
MTDPIPTGIPGEMLFADGDLTLNEGRPTIELEVANTSDRAVQVGSHFHFFEVNRALRFDRRAAFGLRLDIPSGTSIRFEAGQSHRVMLITFGGTRTILGLNELTNGDGAAETLTAAILRPRQAQTEVREQAPFALRGLVLYPVHGHAEHACLRFNFRPAAIRPREHTRRRTDPLAAGIGCITPR